MKSSWNLVRDGMVATGAAIVVFSIGLTVLILVTAVPTNNPYVGLFTVIFLPALVIFGALLFIFGVLLNRPDKQRVARELGLKKWLLAYFKPDFSRPGRRRRLVFFLAAGGLELVIFSTAGFRTEQFMDTPEFCASCHTVMEPEYTVYRNSPMPGWPVSRSCLMKLLNIHTCFRCCELPFVLDFFSDESRAHVKERQYPAGSNDGGGAGSGQYPCEAFQERSGGFKKGEG